MQTKNKRYFDVHRLGTGIDVSKLVDVKQLTNKSNNKTQVTNNFKEQYPPDKTRLRTRGME